MEAGAGHWDVVYRTKAPDEVSWYQAGAGVSLDLIAKHGRPGASVIDIGAGASALVDHLLSEGWGDATLLDVSSEGLDVTLGRLGSRAEGVTFVVADLLTWIPRRSYGVWHDRAVFHFLVRANDRSAYLRTATNAVEPGGVLVLGTFADDGPEQCSGLPTARYDPDELARIFDPAFELVESMREVHRTPWGSEQPFTWVVLRRRADPAC